MYNREGEDPIKLNLGATHYSRSRSRQWINNCSIASMSNHCIALNNDGDVYVWGNSGQGRLGLETRELVPFAVPLGMRVHDAMSGYKASVSSDRATPVKGQAGSSSLLGKAGGGKRRKRSSDDANRSRGVGHDREKPGAELMDSAKDGQDSLSGGVDGLLGGGGDINTGMQYFGSEIDIAIEKFRRNRINPSAQFVYGALKSEPVANRLENINTMTKTISSIRVQIEESMENLYGIEREIGSLESEIEIMLKSSISNKMPTGLSPARYREKSPKITADIVLQHSVFTKILELMLTNPNYIQLMHKYYTSETTDVKLLWERDATPLKSTFKRRFAEMIISIYGNMERPHNEHLFLVCARNIMLEELDKNYSGDMSKIAANFVSGESVFGELVRSYFSLDKNIKDVESRYSDLLKDMIAKTDSNEYNFEYDPAQVYYEIRRSQGKIGAAEKQSVSFSDAQREDLYNSLIDVKNTVTSRVSLLCSVSAQWIDITKQSVQGIDNGVRWICRELLNELKKSHGRGKGAEYVVASFLFDMYFRPVLINPKVMRIENGGRRRMPKRLIKNLNAVAIMIKRSMTYAKYNSRIRWMVEANNMIERNHTSSLQWIREVSHFDMDLPQKMLIDVYKEYLRYGPSFHTLRLHDVHLLRWLLLRFEKVQIMPNDPMQPYVLGPFGLFPPGDEVAIQLAENFARAPETVVGLGINFELNTRFFEKMRRARVKIDPLSEVPLPDYLAMDDCIELQDLEIESRLDSKRKAFQDWLCSMSEASDFQIPTTNNGQSDIAIVRDEILRRKDEKQRQKKYSDLEMLDNADKLLQQLLQEHTPLTMVMGEILEQIAYRGKVANKQKRELDSLYSLRTNIEVYQNKLETKRTNRVKYKDCLLRARGQEPGNTIMAKSAALRVNETVYEDDLIGNDKVKPSNLKKRLARSREVRGCHAEYSLKYLRDRKVVTDFTLDPTARVSALELKKVEQSVEFKVRGL